LLHFKAPIGDLLLQSVDASLVSVDLLGALFVIS
jgi:hypothetical protein